MSRSLKKGPYINVKLEKKVLAMNESGKKAVHLESHEWKPRVGSELQVEVEKIEVRKE